ncbi:MAG: hypothetical protein HY290_16080 [Planctomycetia bacterium]|nr:hypothetical protein [Planctomycetia bacterium]
MPKENVLGAVGDGWNVALGRFGADFVATTSEAGGDLCFLTADGKQKTSIDFGYIASLDVLPVSPTEFAVIAINEFSEGVAEEVIAVRHDRVLFRQRIGHCGNKTWRTRRIVSGKLIDGKSTVIAVLRGDSSVVIFDAAGKPLHMLPSIHARTAIEPGPPDQGHDTLICCDGKTLRRFVFPAALPPEIAKERVTVKNPNEGFLKIEEQDSADELWARALWLSLPPNQASSDEVASLFSAALSRAKMKAPIYVSFGDAASGPNVMREMLNRAAMALTSAFATDLASNARPLARKLDLPKDESTKLLELTIQKSFENALKQDRVRGEIDALVANMKDGSDASMTYYVAAIAEDQDFMPAWYRLATRSKGEQRSHAVAEFIRRDSENALPHYLRAADEIENGDLSAGLKSVQAGNRLKACRIYNSPRPKAFALKWPDNEFCREFGVVGAPLHKTALDFLLDEVEQSFTWNDPLTHDIRKIGRQLTEEGRRLQKDGQSADALSFLEAAEGLGIQLMKVEPRDAGMIVTGLGISRNCSDELKTAYKILGDEAKVRRAEEAEATCVRIRNEIIKALDARKLSKDDVKAILKGQNNPGEEARARLERALIHSGLITVPSDSKD